ncbi:YraN family protein [Rhodobacteraceae bacterium KMM 6894]|nr:YraN family protein [Rhodobacteraceae bacterium KMM 6894]
MTQIREISTAGGAPVQARRDRGRRAYCTGLAAEDRASALYIAAGLVALETRWRGKGGEIDLIFENDGTIVFCEVKQARTHDAAIASLRPAQMRRIHMAASEYLGLCPDGQLTDTRFDLASVDGTGHCQIHENMLAHF